MEINIQSVLFLVGILQAIVLLIGINIRTPFRTLKQKTMSALLLTMVFLMFFYIVVVNELYEIWPYVDSLGSAAWMALTPIYYLFCKSITESNWKLTWKAVPLFSVPILFCVEGILTSLGFEVWLYTFVNDSKMYLDVWMGIFFVTGIYFVVKSVKLFHLKSAEKQRNTTLAIFTYSLLAVFIGYAITYLFVRNNYPIWFELSLVIWCEIFIFVLVYKVFTFQSLTRLLDPTKYEKESLTEKKRAQLTAQLEKKMMEELPFLDQELNLSKLSNSVGISTNNLSQLFTSHYQSNFYSFVNGYRLSHAEKLLKSPKHQNYTIQALLEESGFKSKATFYKVFKSKHGCAPSEYIKKSRSTQ